MRERGVLKRENKKKRYEQGKKVKVRYMKGNNATACTPRIGGNDLVRAAVHFKGDSSAPGVASRGGSTLGFRAPRVHAFNVHRGGAVTSIKTSMVHHEHDTQLLMSALPCRAPTRSLGRLVGLERV